MPEHSGHIELDRRVDSIHVGSRHRKDAGDVDALMDSIERLGLLQPITVTPEGVLVCGWRRLEAVKRLGWRTLRVWVRSGISDNLSHLLAQQDENTMHKPLSELEAASLYRELKRLMAEDSARRQQATRFGRGQSDGEANGDAESASPGATAGTTRRQAAELVTGKAAYSRLEQVGALEDVATDAGQPKAIRLLAIEELKQIQAGAPVNPAYQRVRAAIEAVRRHQPTSDDAKPCNAEELEFLAAEALERVRTSGNKRSRKTPTPSPPNGPVPHTLRSFVLTWGDLDGWTAHYAAAEVGPALSDEEWAQFERVVHETTEFAALAQQARAQVLETATA